MKLKVVADGRKSSILDKFNWNMLETKSVNQKISLIISLVRIRQTFQILKY